MMAWMNRESWKKRLRLADTFLEPVAQIVLDERGSSGHTQTVKDVAFDCDGDTLLIQGNRSAACHEGYQSCFFRSVGGVGREVKITGAPANDSRKNLRIKKTN